MTQRKKFLFAGLGLNLFFYTAISIALINYNIRDTESFLHTQLRQFLQLEEMIFWEKQQTSVRFLQNYYASQWSISEASAAASAIGITSVVLKSDPLNTFLLLNQKEQPIPESFFESKKEVALFHTDKERSYITFLITPQVVAQLPGLHTVTIELPLFSLPRAFAHLKSDITVLERNWSGTNVVYTTFNRETRDHFKKKFAFDVKAPIAREQNFQLRDGYQSTMVVGSDKYLVYPLYLINQENFSQVVLFTFKLKDFVTFNVFSALVTLILLFCISTGTLFAIYMWSRDTQED